MTFEGLPFNSVEEAVKELRNIGFGEAEAKDVAKILEAEAEEDLDNAKSLWENLKNKADAIIAGLGLETASFVGNPSQPSKFVMMKSDDGGFNTTSPLLKDSKKEEDWEVVYAPAMQPSAVDKDGEVIPSEVIKNSAHEFLATGKTDQIDADHNLITGKGKVVESWISKEDKTYKLPDHYEEDEFKVEKGSWMLGVKPTEESKKKIESGEFTGFSIFGEAEKIELDTSFKMKHSESTDIEEDNMPENDNDNTDVGLKDVAEGVETLKESLNDLSEEVSEIKEDSTPEAKEVSTVEELKEALGSEEAVQLQLEADDLPLKEEKEEGEGESEGEGKESDVEMAVEMLADEMDVDKEKIREALGISEEEDSEEKEEGEGEGETEKSVKGKSTLGEGLRKSELEDDEKSGELNFQEAAKKSVEEA